MLCLSSDQSKNTILVSGDTTGRLQIWDMSHYALDIQDKVSWCPDKRMHNAPYTLVYFTYSLSTQSDCERPTLLQQWRAHKGGLVSAEVLEVASGLFVLTASADGSAGLWTKDGDHVGSFGQKVMWNITDAAAYQR